MEYTYFVSLWVKAGVQCQLKMTISKFFHTESNLALTVSTVVRGIMDLDASSARVCRAAPISARDPSYSGISDRL